MDGIYIAYVSGQEGYSAILFVLRNHRITGADVGGLKYQGEFQTHEDKLVGKLVVELSPGEQLITGFQAGAKAMSYSVPFEIEFKEIGTGFIRISSPLGDVTASIQKIQELP
jgi:hypothetical protein